MSFIFLRSMGMRRLRSVGTMVKAALSLTPHFAFTARSSVEAPRCLAALGVLILSGNAWAGSAKTPSEIFAQQELVAPKSPLVLTSAQAPTGTERLLNKYFEITIPKCFEAADGSDGSDILSSPLVNLVRKKNCGSTSSEVNNVDVYRDPYGQNSLDTIHLQAVLYKQAVVLNGQKAVAYADVVQDGSGLQLRWGIYTFCGPTIFTVGFANKPGDESIARIDKKNFDLPKEFMEIASSFKCAKPSKEKTNK